MKDLGRLPKNASRIGRRSKGPATAIADRIREALQYLPPEKVYINPDCGFFQLPRWLTVRKLQRMVEGAKIVRHELAG